jgi:dTDP-4-amino-4,6-dideoxygalactose transaminase
VDIVIPSIIPPVVPNTIFNAGLPVVFNNNTTWVGGNYTMTNRPIMGYIDIIDSAHEIYKDHYNDVRVNESDLVIYSFYPTKPLSGMDGGAIVSNEYGIIDLIRILSHNGIQLDGVQKFVGHKFYMNSVQAYIANENLKRIGERHERINKIRGIYDVGLKCHKYVTRSYHLYIIRVKDNYKFVKIAEAAGIECKIHYTPQHSNLLYGLLRPGNLTFNESLAFGKTCVSIPFHEALTDKEVETVIKYVNSHA